MKAFLGYKEDSKQKLDTSLREGSSAIDYTFQNYNYGGNQCMSDGMSFENSLTNLKAKCDFIALKVQLDDTTNMFEQKRNANVFNSNHIICDLCGGYHTNRTCRQVQNVD